jgi:hypothetical protein
MLEEAEFRKEEIDERQASHVIDEGQERLEQAKFSGSVPEACGFFKKRADGAWQLSRVSPD